MSLMLTLLAHAGESHGFFPLALPPLHPLLVNFTAALIPASLVSDVLGRMLRKPSLLAAGWWMLLFAAIITPFTAAAGWWWSWRIGGPETPVMEIHESLGTALAVIVLGLVYWRWRIYRRDNALPSRRYLLCAAALVAALVIQGHLGATMSFSESEQTPSSQPIVGNGVQWRDHIDMKEHSP